ncbi:hypothetical protein DFH27DRAFT_133931 [Peziza echinospora]|nr:hypothetical protein DFH27DRAFT_133931 [Peziza echinospora]
MPCGSFIVNLSFFCSGNPALSFLYGLFFFFLCVCESFALVFSRFAFSLYVVLPFRLPISFYSKFFSFSIFNCLYYWILLFSPSYSPLIIIFEFFMTLFYQFSRGLSPPTPPSRGTHSAPDH